MARKGVDYRAGLAQPDHSGADYRQVVGETRSAFGVDWRAALAAEHGRSGVDFREAVARPLGYRWVDWKQAEVGPGGDAADETSGLLVAGSGSYLLTGVAASVFHARALGAGAGSYALTGSSATLTASLAAPLTGLSFSGAWSPGRLLDSSYVGAKDTNSTGAYDSWLDQTGNSRPLKQTTTARPTVATAGPNSRPCGDFDGSDDFMSTATDNILLSSFMSATAGYVIISCLPDTVTTNSANPYENDALFGDTGGFMGLYLRNTAGTPETIQAFNFDGSNDSAESATISVGTVYVLEWWHASGNLFLCVNNGTPVSVASGDSGSVGNTIGLGLGYGGSSANFDGKVFEAAIAPSVPASRATIAANFMTWAGAV